jgi:predicted transcriptional regulator
MTEKFLRAWHTGEYQGEYLTFSTPTQLFAVFPPKRWELITKLQELGPSSLRALARAVHRDVKRVHEDAAALLAEGVFERNDQQKLFVPFETIHISFDLVTKAAA